MRPDLAGYVQGALTIFGALLQFVRASRSISDWFTLPAGAVVAIVVWALAVDWTAVTDWQEFILKGIPTVAGCISSVMGGTFMTAKVANSAKDTSSAFVPATDSKK